MDFWPKVWFVTKISIFGQNFNFWPKFRFLTKSLIFEQKFDFWTEVWFLTKISIFDQHFNFWLNLQSRNNRFFGLTSKLWRRSKSWNVVQKYILCRHFGQKLKFWSKIEILVKKWNFAQKWKFWSKIEIVDMSFILICSKLPIFFLYPTGCKKSEVLVDLKKRRL